MGPTAAANLAQALSDRQDDWQVLAEEFVVPDYAACAGRRIGDLGLRKPIYRKTAAYGHFGRDDIEFPWERTDKAEALKSAAGL